jgi:hypothetical protein
MDNTHPSEQLLLSNENLLYRKRAHTLLLKTDQSIDKINKFKQFFDIVCH